MVGDLHAVERHLRQAYAATGRLAVSSTEAQADRNLSPIAGHQIFAAISGTGTEIAAAIARISEGHRMFERMGKSLGIDVTAFGDGQKPPEESFPTGILAVDASTMRA